MLESIVAETVDVGFDNKIGCLVPYAAIHRLRDGETLPDDIKKVTWTISVGPTSFEMHGQDFVGPHLTQWSGWHGMGKHAIDQQATTDLYRQKHARVGTTGANRF